MPKFSLKRRHRREHDLCALRDCSDSLTRAAARMVSDDDIHTSSGESKTFSSDVEFTSTATPTPLSPRMTRPDACCRLSDLANECSESDLDSDFLCVSPSRKKTSQDFCQTSTSSPWGHFVEMLVPASSSDTEDEQWHSSEKSEKSHRRFLPFCPEPLPSPMLSPHRHHPYHVSNRSRHRSRHSRFTFSVQPHNKNRDHEGFVLTVPEEEFSVTMLEEAQDALRDLHV